MNLVPIGNCLRNFSVNPSTHFRSQDEDDSQSALQAEACRQAEALGHAAGEREAIARLEADHELRLSAAIAQAREQLSSEMARRSDEQLTEWANAAAASLRAALGELEGSLSTRIAQCLRPLVLDAAEREAISQIARDIGRLGDGALSQIKVTGPQALIDKFAQALPDLKFDSAASTTVELSIQVNETTLSTRLSDWQSAYLERNP
jgi:hypothetical protein